MLNPTVMLGEDESSREAVINALDGIQYNNKIEAPGETTV